MECKAGRKCLFYRENLFAMNLDDLFDTLDADGDDALSRADLNRASRRLHWHWHEAPLYAVLDRLTVEKPLTRHHFVSVLNRIAADPYGPYGRVLEDMDNRYPEGAVESLTDPAAERPRDARKDLIELLHGTREADLLETLEQFLNERACRTVTLSSDESALLIIDPQRSFTSGAWRHSFGPGAEDEVRPIERVFKNCASLLKALGGKNECMFTRCPFPPDSYDWDDGIRHVMADDQIYFVKPGNSVMWPPTNGYRAWIDSLLRRGKSQLVMGGCTLNSCVRVSAIETFTCFSKRGLEVVVDLSLSGARAGNYRPSGEFGGMSSVESAVREMIASGVTVARRTDLL
jgi:hypothetical protein